MKSKMKSAFALIAVALMIMVAVVPMIGVFTSESDATTIITPTTAKKITVKVTVYDAPASNGYIKADWGNGLYTTGYVPIAATNPTTLTLDDTSAQNLTIGVYIYDSTTQTYTLSKDYSTAELKGLVGDNIYTADIVKNYQNPVELTLTMKNASTTLADILWPLATPATGTVQVTYELYEDEAMTAAKKITTNRNVVTLSSDSSKIKAYIPNGYTEVYLKITKITVDGKEQAISMATPAHIAGASATVTTAAVDQYGQFAYFNANIPDGKVTAVTGKDSATTPVSITDVKILSAEIGKTKKAIFTYKTTEATSLDVTFTVGTSSQTATTTSVTSDIFTVTPAKAYYGTYTMGAIEAADGQTLKMFAKNGSTDAALTVFVANGFYYAAWPSAYDKKEGGNDPLAIKVEAATGFTVSAFGTNTKATEGDYKDYYYNSNGIAAGDNYVTLTAAALVDGTVAKVPSYYTFAVSGYKAIFGAKENGASATITTGAATSGSAAFKFYVVAGDAITFTTTSGTLTTDSVGPFIVPTAGITPALKLVDKKIAFTFADDDGLSVDAATVVSTTATANIIAWYLLPGSTTYLPTWENNAAANGAEYTQSKIAVTLSDATVDVTKIKVYFTNNTGKNNSFSQFDKDTAVLYSETNKVMSVKTLDKLYTIVVKDANDNVITTSLIDGTTAADGMQLLGYNAYIAEGSVGSTKVNVYNSVDVAMVAGLTWDGDTLTYYFKADKSLVNVTLATTAKKILAVTFGDNVTYIKDAIYKVNVDNDGVMTIKFSADSLTGYLYRISDMSTPIEGAVATLYNGDTAVAGAVATTDSDGKFTVSSPYKIGAGYKMNFSCPGYTFTAQTAYENLEKVTSYYSTTDYYAFGIIDADGKVYVPGYGETAASATTDKLTVTVDDVATAMTTDKSIEGFATNAVWNAGDVMSITLKDQDTTPKTLRTFANYTLTADDVASGMIILTTCESTYTVKGLDAEEASISLLGATLGVYTKTGNSYNAATIIGQNTLSTTVGYKTYVLTATATEGYYVKVDGATNAGYKFDTGYVAIDVGNNFVESDYAPIYVTLKDGNGTVLSVAKTTAGSKAVQELTYETVEIALTCIDGKLKLIGDPMVSYKYNLTGVEVVEGSTTIPVLGNYASATSTKLVAKDGVIKFSKEEVTFNVLDASGAVIGNGTNYWVQITGINSETMKQDVLVKGDGANKGKQLGADGTVTAKFDASAYDGYIVFLSTAETLTAQTTYTFEKSDSTVILANEQTIGAAFFTINGSSEAVASYTIKAFSEDGKLIKSSGEPAADATIIVDTDEVAYYEATIGGAVAVGTGYFPAGLVVVSDDNAFVSPYTKITGSLPVAAAAGDYVMIEEYLGEQVVFTDKVDLAAGAKTYTIFADITGMVDEVAGIAFDSIFATYVHDGAVYASVPVDPTAVFNPIVTPGSAVIQYVAVLVPPSAVIADHVDYAQVGNTVTVTADANFFVADDESIYTDGQYKYVFAGWYVDNEKVSANPVFTFAMTEDVVISPQYTVTYEKTSDVNKDVEKEYVNIVEKVEVPVEKTVGIDTNVLIIGICAVIVALIAVVYAVIKKD